MTVVSHLFARRQADRQSYTNLPDPSPPVARRSAQAGQPVNRSDRQRRCVATSADVGNRSGSLGWEDAVRPCLRWL